MVRGIIRRGTLLLCVLAVPAAASAQEPRIRIEVPVQVIVESVGDAMDASMAALHDAFDAIRDRRGRPLLQLDHLRSLRNLRRLELDVDLDAALALAGRLDAGAQDRDFRASQVDRQTRTFDLGASGRLELGNIVGDITVTSAPGSQAIVEIVRTARGRTDADARRGLDQVTVEVTEEGGLARLRTEYPRTRGRSPYSVSVDYIVRAPAGTRVTASSVSGDVRVTGITAAVTTDVISGDTHVAGGRSAVVAKAVSGNVTIDDVQSSETIDITSINGDVRLTGVRGRRLSVNGVSGDVTATDVEVEGADLKSMAGDVTYAGTIRQSGRYTFQAHSGDIELTLSGAGFDLEASTFSGSIRPSSAMTMTDVTASRRSVRGRVAGGGAVIEATTFSGDVTITRR